MEEEALAHESKMSALDAHEARWKAQFDLQQANNSSYYSSLYVSSMRIGGFYCHESCEEFAGINLSDLL
jgi:hypothetical protein